MYKKMDAMNTPLRFWHESLADKPALEWVIVYRNGFKSYYTFEDAYDDLPFKQYLYGRATMMRVSRYMAMAGDITFVNMAAGKIGFS
jgi:hypothetical protein